MAKKWNLIVDVERYPQFLPWCVATRIKTREGDTFTADLIAAFGAFREQFTSRVILDRAGMAIGVEYLDGPFKFMRSNWAFRDREEGGCDVSFFVDFEFKNVILQKLIGVVFDEAMHRVVRAFEAASGHQGFFARPMPCSPVMTPTCIKWFSPMKPSLSITSVSPSQCPIDSPR